MCGIQRVPSLLYEKPDAELSEYNLENYEVLLNEPMHDISNYIKNLFEEIPYYIKDKEAKCNLKECIAAAFNGKTAKNSADYRLAIIKVTTYCKKNIQNDKIIKLFETSLNIQEALYLRETERTVQAILRLYIQIFLHVLLLRDVIGSKPKKLIYNRMYGKYYHSLIHHSPNQLRIISGRAANTEKEESTFNTIKTITNNTSTRHPEHIINNAFIRIQVNEQKNEGEIRIRQVESSITKLYTPIKQKLKNSFISFETIERYPYDYQALLESIADYLYHHQLFWKETDSGIEFYDITAPHPLDKPVYHFRSFTVITEQQFVSDC